MGEERKCIKCGEKHPLGMFDDNWRHKVNICKDCQRAYAKLYRTKAKTAIRIRRLRKRIKELESEIRWLNRQKQE